MDIQCLPRQDETEELVTAGTDRANFADGLIIGKDRHKAGDAALDLDFKQDVGFGQAALGRAATMLLTMTAVMRWPSG